MHYHVNAIYIVAISDTKQSHSNRICIKWPWTKFQLSGVSPGMPLQWVTSARIPFRWVSSPAYFACYSDESPARIQRIPCII